MKYDIGNCVYFIGSKIPDGKVKIGKTKNLNMRLAGLNTSHHTELVVYCYYKVENMDDAEIFMHIEAASKNIRNEWFELSIEEVEILYEKLQKKYKPSEKNSNNNEDNQTDFGITSIRDWLLHKNIRIINSPYDRDSLLFSLRDVANAIGDVNYRRYKSEYIQKIEMKDSYGVVQKYLMLTEIGFYDYLLKSNRSAAKSFRDYVYVVLVDVRKKSTTNNEINFQIDDFNIDKVMGGLSTNKSP